MMIENADRQRGNKDIFHATGSRQHMAIYLYIFK